MGLDFQGTESQVEKVKLLIAAMICQSWTMIVMLITMMNMVMKTIMEMMMMMMRRRRMTSDL